MKKQAVFHFHADLNEFLSPNNRERVFSVTFRGSQSVKHLIESLGVPHTEVGCILVNSLCRDFSYITQDGDEIQVYPATAENNQDSMGLHDKPPGEARFVLDDHLGRLAVYLRMLGFDALYQNDYQDGELARLASLGERILLTRDRRLLMRTLVVYGYCLRSKIPRQQLIEVLRRYELYSQVVPFRRCMRCNGLLNPVSKESVLMRLEQLTKKYFDEFRICLDCDQVYWKGSHYERMQALIEGIVSK